MAFSKISCFLFTTAVVCSFSYFSPLFCRTFTESDMKVYRLKVMEMFRHAYEGYLSHAFPFDELKPLSCHGVDTWGSFSLTLIDALDTLVIMENFTEFRRVVSKLVSSADFNININVSVFETNIRVVGGLISAHLLSQKAGIQVDPGWPCSGPLLNLAEGVARRLLPAFKTETGMPYGTVNLRFGVPPGETPITCTAGVSTFILEFGTLSRLTGDPIFERVAMKALHSLWKLRSPIGLVGNHINVQEGKWTAMDSGIGGGIDSYYEYLVKGSVLFQKPKLMKMFKAYQRAITRYIRHDDWHFWVSMGTGQVTLPVFQSLEAFWPGLLSLVGGNEQAVKTLYNYHQVWKQFGFTPEFYDVSHNHVKREGYPLRPELIESIMYLYYETKDTHLLELGVDILESIQYSAKTECGYATIKNVIDHRIEDRMESFFLAETTKYLYLLFDPENFIHNNGSCGTIITTTGGDCVLGTGGYVFNTEAHPIDIAAVYCCSAKRKEHELLLQNFQTTMDLHSLLNINSNDFLSVFNEDHGKKCDKSKCISRTVKHKKVAVDTEIKTVAVEKVYSKEPLESDITTPAKSTLSHFDLDSENENGDSKYATKMDKTHWETRSNGKKNQIFSQNVEKLPKSEKIAQPLMSNSDVQRVHSAGNSEDTKAFIYSQSAIENNSSEEALENHSGVNDQSHSNNAIETTTLVTGKESKHAGNFNNNNLKISAVKNVNTAHKFTSKNDLHSREHNLSHDLNAINISLPDFNSLLGDNKLNASDNLTLKEYLISTMNRYIYFNSETKQFDLLVPDSSIVSSFISFLSIVLKDSQTNLNSSNIFSGQYKSGKNYSILSCPSKALIQWINLMGEMFNTKL